MWISELQTHQHLARSALPENSQAALTHEKGFLHVDRPSRIGFEWIGQAVGVLADDEMALFQAQQALRLHSEGAQPGGQAGIEQRPPNGLSGTGRHMDLKSQFTDEAYPQQSRFESGNPPSTYRQVRKRLPGQVRIGQTLKNLPAGGTGKVEGRAMPGNIDQRALQSPQRL